MRCRLTRQFQQRRIKRVTSSINKSYFKLFQRNAPSTSNLCAIPSIKKFPNLTSTQAQIEAQIYSLEGAYTNVHSGGNIIQGFDGYLKNQTTGRRKHEVSEADRIF